MKIDISIQIAGQSGQGIQTIGNWLANVFWQRGLYVTVINDFESRIKGGHSFTQIRITNQSNSAPTNKVNLLAVLNQKSLKILQEKIIEDGLILIDGKENFDKNILSIPFFQFAQEAGDKIMANTVVVGSILGLLGVPFEDFEVLLIKKFHQKNSVILNNNLLAAQKGFEFVKDFDFKWSFSWEKRKPVGPLLNGNRAIALGAVAADCRFAPFYPMSPATGIIKELITLSEDFPLIVEQVEDEIAAINMIIGASYSGIRSLTATSGGGFCLMIEGLGLAGITETPILIINAQRPGPATGLPTRTAQADLQFAIRASQDEFPRFIFAPGSVTEAYELTIKAFHLADKYQVPVILLTDQYLNDSLFTIDHPLKAPKAIERFITTDDDLDDPDTYERYAINDSGVSPRVLPCAGKALAVVTGNEHTPDGHISEDAHNRIQMMNKRNAKLSAMQKEILLPSVDYADSDILLVGWGSTQGAIREAVQILRSQNKSIGSLIFTELWPFPVEEVRQILSTAKSFIMIEQNYSAQLGLLIREQTGLFFYEAILKYDGRPFLPTDIVEQAHKIL